jgi:UDP-2,4-diacetamido-2,4,6-trideoxy-beta-L-altropyranose hydrolase
MKIVILTEGGKNIGFGHVSRCVSLYEAFRIKGITPELVINSDSSVKAILVGKRFRLHNWLKDKNIPALLKDVDILVIDSYKASPEFYQKAAGLVKLGVYLDDNRRLAYPPGVVLNGNIHAERIKYPLIDGVKYILGPKCALLRKEFQKAKPGNPKKRLGSVILTFGGNDIRNFNIKVLELLVKKFPDLEKKLVLGADREELKDLNSLKDAKTMIFYRPDARVLKDIMNSADAAICAGGQTTNELARLGIPAIAVAVADNQLGIVKEWARQGFLIFAGRWDAPQVLRNIENALRMYQSDYRLRKHMAHNGQKLVDGKGPERAVQIILKESKIAWKKTKPCRIIFLSNNPVSQPLQCWLKEQAKEKVFLLKRPITSQDIDKYRPDFIISYNYRHILKSDILGKMKNRAINLHISLLPWNRGANPNIWSFLDNTPKGVTIHLMDAGIDSGNILVQKKAKFDERKETLASSYDKLHKQIQELFIANWSSLKNRQIVAQRQKGQGSRHFVRDFERIKSLIRGKGWNTRLLDLKKGLRENK